MSESLQALDLTYPQYVALSAISQHDTTNLQVVMLHTGYEQCEREVAIRNLQKRGFVKRSSHAQNGPDNGLRCTNRGDEVTALADNLAAEVNAELMNTIEPMHRKTFVEILSYIVAKRR